MIYTLTCNPAIDKTASLQTLQVGALNRLENVVISAAGKGINVSKTLHTLQQESVVFAYLAGNTGQYIEQSLLEMQLETKAVWVEGSTRTNLKVMDANTHLTELNERGPHIDSEKQLEMQALLDANIQCSDLLVLAGSLSTGMDSDYYAKLISHFAKKGVKVILDADGDSFKHAIKEVPFLIKPNAFELCQYMNVKETNDPIALAKMAKELMATGIAMVVISMGKDGALFMYEDQVIYAKGLQVDVKSTVGAGDAMVAALAYAIENELSLEQVAIQAMAISAGACTTSGTEPASKEMIDTLVQQVVLEKIEV